MALRAPRAERQGHHPAEAAPPPCGRRPPPGGGRRAPDVGRGLRRQPDGQVVPDRQADHAPGAGREGRLRHRRRGRAPGLPRGGEPRRRRRDHRPRHPLLAPRPRDAARLSGRPPHAPRGRHRQDPRQQLPVRPQGLLSPPGRAGRGKRPRERHPHRRRHRGPRRRARAAPPRHAPAGNAARGGLRAARVHPAQPARPPDGWRDRRGLLDDARGEPALPRRLRPGPRAVAPLGGPARVRRPLPPAQARPRPAWPPGRGLHLALRPRRPGPRRAARRRAPGPRRHRRDRPAHRDVAGRRPRHAARRRGQRADRRALRHARGGAVGVPDPHRPPRLPRGPRARAQVGLGRAAQARGAGEAPALAVLPPRQGRRALRQLRRRPRPQRHAALQGPRQPGGARARRPRARLDSAAPTGRRPRPAAAGRRRCSTA